MRLLKKNNKFLLSAFFMVTLCLYATGQTIYGVSGMVKSPNAYAIDSGKTVFGTGYFKSNVRLNESDKLYSQWTTFLNFGFHSRFEIGIRLAIFPSIRHFADSTFRFNRSNDRILNSKFVLIREKEQFPQISIGVQDLLGTHLYNLTYVVASKRFTALSAIEINSTVGINATNLYFKPSKQKMIVGLFGGAEINFKKIISFSMEYDSNDFDGGIAFVYNKWLLIKVFTTNNARQCGSLITYKFNL